MTDKRSHNGCWTCRIRKTKCDEIRIACLKCNSLRITCHGYGEKPVWMDGGQSERQEIDRIKNLVKETNKLKRLQRNPKNLISEAKENGRAPTGVAEGGVPLNMALLISNDVPTKFQDGNNDSSEDDDTTLLESAASAFSPLSIVADFPPMPLPRPRRVPEEARLPISNAAERLCIKCRVPVLAEREASLLMHYLDYVFPLQFHFYKPLISEGGRGWLLGIILTTKPLFYAVLSLSAYHIYASQSIDSLDEWDLNNLEDLERDHTLALTELRYHIDGLENVQSGGNTTQQIAILACMVQLVSFEVLRGGSNGWKTHLQGARALIQNLKSYFVAPMSSYKGVTSTPTSFPRPFSEENIVESLPLERGAITALDFFTTAFVWFDTLSCTATGLEPSCPDWLSPLLNNEDGRIQLSKLMGCKNWVVVIIMEIAELDKWKRDYYNSGTLSIRELARRAAGIEERLNDGLATNMKSMLAFEADPYGATNLEVRAVTDVFGCSAVTYLHVVLSGAYPELPEIRESVLKTVKAFHSLKEPRWLRSLVWPFCVAGCMAMTQDEGNFRGIAHEAKLHDQGFNQFEIASDIMEECWAARRETEEQGSYGFDWRTAMKRLGTNVLLV